MVIRIMLNEKYAKMLTVEKWADADQYFIKKLEGSGKNILTRRRPGDTITPQNLDGGPGSGNFGHGGRPGKVGGSSSGNSGKSSVPDKSNQKLNFKRTGNAMSVTKDVKFRSGAKIASGSKITKIVDFAGGNSGKPVRAEEHLIKQHGGSKGSWTHSRGQAMVTAKNGETSVAEIHWFESPGAGQVNMKIKRYF